MRTALVPVHKLSQPCTDGWCEIESIELHGVFKGGTKRDWIIGKEEVSLYVLA